MIQQESILRVTDNSGAKTALCIRVLGGTCKRYACVGDKIVATIKTAHPSTPLKRGTISKAVVVRIRKKIRRKDGSYIRFEDNAIVLIENNNEPNGTAVFGPVALEVEIRNL